MERGSRTIPSSRMEIADSTLTLPRMTLTMQGYLPIFTDRHKAVLERKRREYDSIVQQHFGPSSARDEDIMHQIAIDVPRTAPEVALFKNAVVREAMARVLYCWSIRRPASGYVQGINDLLTPFYDVFLRDCIDRHSRTEGNLQGTELVALPQDVLLEVEADSFWCLSKLLDSIQDNYTFNQIGITRQIGRMREIALRTDPALIFHLEEHGVSLLQFAFRWMNCLLLREFPLFMIERMWDTYLAEGDDGFSEFHIYVCAAFLAKWSSRLQLLDFQDIILFLQTPPTSTWTIQDIEMLLSEAYVWKTLFHDTIGRLASPSGIINSIQY